MAVEGNPTLMTRIPRDLDAAIEARIDLAIAKGTRGARDRADFARRAARQYLRHLERSASSRRRKQEAFSAWAAREQLGVDADAQPVYSMPHPPEDRATLASDPSAGGAASENGKANNHVA